MHWEWEQVYLFIIEMSHRLVISNKEIQWFSSGLHLANSIKYISIIWLPKNQKLRKTIVKTLDTFRKRKVECMLYEKKYQEIMVWKKLLKQQPMNYRIRINQTQYLNRTETSAYSYSKWVQMNKVRKSPFNSPFLPWAKGNHLSFILEGTFFLFAWFS